MPAFALLQTAAEDTAESLQHGAGKTGMQGHEEVCSSSLSLSGTNVSVDNGTCKQYQKTVEEKMEKVSKKKKKKLSCL